MQSAIAHQLDALADWRAGVDRELVKFAQALAEHDLFDESASAQINALRERLAAEKLVLAFVAEFSRGKSELINAIFFADAGRRVLPATPGRTTMCPVELRHDEHLPTRLSLLPVETRLRGLSLSDLRQREDHWQHLALDPNDVDALARALEAVTRTQRVSVAQAGALGFWSEAHPEDNPPRDRDGLVEVPAWRHAVINYPHPLLQRGLVVIDTPGLNAIGAEPELTLGLLPTAHAAVFVLAADTGVTRSDLAVWKDHLGSATLERFVVLNKIDTLADPLATSDEVAAQVDKQRRTTAAALDVPLARVYALSARDALAARVARDELASAASGVPVLEQALSTELAPRRQELMVGAALAVVRQLREGAARRLGERRRHGAEQLVELRGLRGKSGGKLRLMLGRVQAEAVEFERCTSRLAAMRTVQSRLLRGLTELVGSDALRAEFAVMRKASEGRLLNLGGRAPFVALLQRVRERLGQAATQAGELRSMLQASFRDLNTDFGFTFEIGAPPSLESFVQELDLIEHSYGRYFSLGQAWRMAMPAFAEQFRRMLLAKLRVVLESAASEIEMWNRGAAGQIQSQLGERRRAFMRRSEVLQRVQGATGELEQRIAEVQQQDAHLASVLERVEAHAEAAAAAARRLASASQPPVRLLERQNAA